MPVVPIEISVLLKYKTWNNHKAGECC